MTDLFIAFGKTKAFLSAKQQVFFGWRMKDRACSVFFVRNLTLKMQEQIKGFQFHSEHAL